MATKNELLVKYSNVMNDITLAHLKPTELDMFMYILAKAKNQETELVSIDEEVFISVLDPKKQVFTSETKVKNGVYNLRKKVNELYAYDDVENKIFKTFTIFSRLEYDYGNHKVLCKIDETFAWLLNDLGKGNPFTSFEYERFFMLTTKHSKNLYRQLMQWKTRGDMYISLDDFRFIFGLSDKYSPRDIMAKVIKPSLKELLEKKYFAKLECVPSTHGKGGKVYGYNFYFTECVNDDMPGQISMFTDEQGNTQYRTKSKKSEKSKFSNFNERDYDYDALMKDITNG